MLCFLHTLLFSTAIYTYNVKGQAIITKRRLFRAFGPSSIPLKTEEGEPHRLDLLGKVVPGSLT